MPVNYNAYMRYQVIDTCLRNRYHLSSGASDSGIWTLQELADACEEKIGKRPAERTLKLDIQRMRSGELGFTAPIDNCYGEGYKYADLQFSINQLPLNEDEREQIAGSLQILKKFHGMPYFGDIYRIVQRLDPGSSILEYIQYEPIGIVKGYEYFTPILQALEENRQLKICYKPYHEAAIELMFNPAFIKEYNQRWYVLGTNQEQIVYNIAFDRIEKIELQEVERQAIPPQLYEKQNHIVGITVPDKGKTNKIRFKVSKEISPYFQTKPLHSSQRLIDDSGDMDVFELKAMVNIELISRLLAFGEAVIVERPAYLAKRIKQKLEETLAHYL